MLSKSIPVKALIVREDEDKPLTILQERVLEADLTGRHTTLKALAEATGATPAGVKLIRVKPQYLKRYNQAKEIEASKVKDIGDHTAKEAKTALAKLKVLVDTSEDPILYGNYLKLLLEVGKGASEAGWTQDQASEDIDIEGVRSDLNAIITACLTSPADQEAIVQSYLDTGLPPTE